MAKEERPKKRAAQLDALVSAEWFDTRVYLVVPRASAASENRRTEANKSELQPSLPHCLPQIKGNNHGQELRVLPLSAAQLEYSRPDEDSPQMSQCPTQREKVPSMICTAWPHTRTFVILSPSLFARTKMWLGRLISTPCWM